MISRNEENVYHFSTAKTSDRCVRLNKYEMKLHILVQNILTEDVLMIYIYIYMSKSVPCITTVDEMEFRRVTPEQSTNKQDVLSKILMGTNFASSSMIMRQNFSSLNCTPTHDSKRKSCRSQNLSRTSR